ncbi:MAG: hypothetical protein WBG95_17415 [Sulfitobacter sp.]
MYTDDSFYTLTLTGRLGVLALSGLLFLVTVGVSAALMRGRRAAVRLATGAFIFVLFVWLSPQAYYALYRFLIDGLPQQWVIGAPPPLEHLLGLITFTGMATLSEHGQGMLFWALVWLSWRSRPRAPLVRVPDP